MDLPLLLKEYPIEDQIISLFGPDQRLIQQRYQRGEIDFPYWSQVWPAAIALSRFLVQHPHYTKHKNVLELAAGLGLPSLVAATNAAHVQVSDYAPEALTCIQKTVAYHHLQNIQVSLLDWTALPVDLSADVLLLSDVSYDTTLFAIQERNIRRFLANGTTVIISTPQRLIAKEAIAPLLPSCTQQMEMMIDHHGKEVAVTVLVLQ